MTSSHETNFSHLVFRSDGFPGLGVTRLFRGIIIPRFPSEALTACSAKAAIAAQAFAGLHPSKNWRGQRDEFDG